MAIPAQVAADLIVIESEGFAGLQVLFDVPPASDSLHHGGQGGIRWGSDQEIGQLVRVVEAAAHDEPMATVRDTSMHHGQASPVKKALPFGAQARRVAVPIPGTERLLCNAGHVDSAGGRCGSAHRRLRWRGRPARRHSLAPPTTLATQGSGRRPYRPPPSGWASEQTGHGKSSAGLARVWSETRPSRGYARLACAADRSTSLGADTTRGR